MQSFLIFVVLTLTFRGAYAGNNGDSQGSDNQGGDNQGGDNQGGDNQGGDNHGGANDEQGGLDLQSLFDQGVRFTARQVYAVERVLKPVLGHIKGLDAAIQSLGEVYVQVKEKTEEQLAALKRLRSAVADGTASEEELKKTELLVADLQHAIDGAERPSYHSPTDEGYAEDCCTSAELIGADRDDLTDENRKNALMYLDFGISNYVLSGQVAPRMVFFAHQPLWSDLDDEPEASEKSQKIIATYKKFRKVGGNPATRSPPPSLLKTLADSCCGCCPLFKSFKPKRRGCHRRTRRGRGSDCLKVKKRAGTHSKRLRRRNNKSAT